MNRLSIGLDRTKKIPEKYNCQQEQRIDQEITTRNTQTKDEVDQSQEKQRAEIGEMPEIDLRRPDGMKQLIIRSIEQLTKEVAEEITTMIQCTDLIGILEESNGQRRSSERDIRED